MVPHLEAHSDRGRDSAGVFEQGADVGVDRHGQWSSGSGAGLNRARTGRAGGDPGHPGDGSEEVDQRAEVVGAHVQQRAAAGLIVELGRGMPTLVARGGPLHLRGDRFANKARIEYLPGRLDAGTEHRVRRAAQAQTKLLGEFDHGLSLRGGETERFLREDVFTGAQGAGADLDVGGGDRQVEHRVDLGVGEELLDSEHAHAVLLSDLRGALVIEIGDRDEAQSGKGREVREILLADLADSDHSDIQRDAHSRPLSMMVVTLVSWRTSTRCPGVETKMRPAPH
jgi:hypothetical protein